MEFNFSFASFLLGVLAGLVVTVVGFWIWVMRRMREDDRMSEISRQGWPTVEDSNTHRTPLPPHDKVNIKATVTRSDGIDYTIEAARPMVEEPRGRHTTWAGVGFGKWNHGRSGIGTDALPPTRSDVAVFALGNISSGGKSIAVDVPVRVLTSPRPDARLELHVGDPAAPVAGLQDGHLRVVWADYSGGPPKSAKYARYALGTGVLLVLLGCAISMARRDAPVASRTGESSLPMQPARGAGRFS